MHKKYCIIFDMSMGLIKKRINEFKKLDSLLEYDSKTLWKNQGFQVIISTHNDSKKILRTLQSVESAMSGTNWILQIGNDKSTDDTLDLLRGHRSCAKEFRLYDFDKAPSVATAKNRITQKIKEFEREYPAILYMDGDDIMAPKRATGMLREAKEQGSKFILGKWVNDKGNLIKLKSAMISMLSMGFGPWATLIHSSIIPEDGRFFFDGVDAHEDLILWRELKKANIRMDITENVFTCRYFSGLKDGSGVAVNKDVEKRDKMWSEYKYLINEIDKL